MILLCTTLIQRQYNVEAHADMSTLIPIRILSTLHYAICHTSKGMWLYTSRGHLPLRCSWLCTKFAKFRSVKNKASSKRLRLCRNTSTLPSPRLSIPSYKLKGKCSTWREQNGYPIAKVKKYLESHNDFTNFFRIILKNVGVRAHNVPLSYIKGRTSKFVCL